MRLRRDQQQACHLELEGRVLDARSPLSMALRGMLPADRSGLITLVPKEVSEALTGAVGFVQAASGATAAQRASSP